MRIEATLRQTSPLIQEASLGVAQTHDELSLVHESEMRLGGFHVLSLHEGELDCRPRDRERNIADSNLRLRELTATLRPSHN
jgi:hypothetical protein